MVGLTRHLTYKAHWFSLRINKPSQDHIMIVLLNNEQETRNSKYSMIKD